MTIRIKKPEYLWEKGNRENNEDSLFPLPGKGFQRNRLFVVCDGLGGHKHGEVASRIACEAIADYAAFEKEFNPEKALRFIELRFSDLIELKPVYNGMCTTIVFLYFTDEEAIIAWVGDSRGYHIRDGNILFQTEDHSLINEMIKRRELTKKQAATDYRRNIITRSIQGSINPVQIDFRIIKDIQPGDYFFLCSDGMLEHIDEIFIKNHFKSSNNPPGLKENIEKLCRNKTRDNYSMYLIQIEG